MTVRVFTSDAALPVENAAVIVWRQDAPRELLGTLLTDSAGKAELTGIAVPDIELGETPEDYAKPWTGLTVLVDHPDYERVTLTGVQVFPETTTILNVALLPLQEFGDQREDQDFFFTAQPIWEGTP